LVAADIENIAIICRYLHHRPSQTKQTQRARRREYTLQPASWLAAHQTKLASTDTRFDKIDVHIHEVPSRATSAEVRCCNESQSASSVPDPRNDGNIDSMLQATPEDQPELTDLTAGLNDQPVILDEGARQVDWTRSFHGLAADPFPKEAADILLAPLAPDDIEVKPDGIVYLPEIKYRRILNKAFGPGGWGLAPRGETIVTAKSVTREYALVVGGRFVSLCSTI